MLSNKWFHRIIDSKLAKIKQFLVNIKKSLKISGHVKNVKTIFLVLNEKLKIFISQ